MSKRKDRLVRITTQNAPRRGVALVVVLWTVAILATVTAVASSGARSSASVSANMRALATARAMAESGVIASVTLVDDSLRALQRDEAARDAYLESLEPATMGALPLVQDTLADGVFAVTVVDVSARLDINNAGVEGLARLFATATTPTVARRLAERIDAAIAGDAEAAARDEQLRARDSLTAALLGRERTPGLRRPFESLDAVREVAGADAQVLDAVAQFLTVDGDGRTNRRGASREVMAAATGSLVDAPTRLLVISRGWQRGHLLTREIQAVYDVAGDGLRLVRWRERDL